MLKQLAFGALAIAVLASLVLAGCLHDLRQGASDAVIATPETATQVPFLSPTPYPAGTTAAAPGIPGGSQVSASAVIVASSTPVPSPAAARPSATPTTGCGDGVCGVWEVNYTGDRYYQYCPQDCLNESLCTQLVANFSRLLYANSECDRDDDCVYYEPNSKIACPKVVLNSTGNASSKIGELDARFKNGGCAAAPACPAVRVRPWCRESQNKTVVMAVGQLLDFNESRRLELVQISPQYSVGNATQQGGFAYFNLHQNGSRVDFFSLQESSNYDKNGISVRAQKIFSGVGRASYAELVASIPAKTCTA